jgi:Uma2 family endonuclease
MASPQKAYEIITEADYLALERDSLDRHEFDQGQCIAMAGGSRWHNLLAGRLFSAIAHHLDDKSCVPYIADMRLYLKADQHYVYPDILVVCHEDAYMSDDMVNDATVIIEVLSPGTEAQDRGRKFLHYQNLPSLVEYMLISQKMMQVELFRKGSERKWEYERWNQEDDEILIQSLEFSYPLKKLYRSMTFVV